MADYVIIGGGVYGTAVAWHLAGQGAEVVVLERKTIASGASGGPGRRGVRANGRDIRELPLMRLAHPVWETLGEELDEIGLFERKGHMILIEREQDVARLRVQAEVQNRLGIPTQILDAAQVHALEPGVHNGILGGIYCAADGASDHARTTRAYARAAERRGAVIREGVEVAAIDIRDGRATGVTTTDGEPVTAASGVLVLSNWSVAEILADHVAIPAWSRAFQVLVSHPLAEVPVRHVIGHASRVLSLKEEDGGRLMISGGHPGHYDRTTHVGTALPAAIAANVADAVATYPALAGMEVDVADAGHLEAVSIDNIPVIDRLPGCGNVWFATGWCGHGWAIAPVVAEMLADFVTEGVCPDLLKPFSVSRFG